MPGSVLLVEDDAEDARLICEAFTAVGAGEAVQHVPDGETAMSYLKGTGAYSLRDLHPLPKLVLLDLKLPKMPGLDVLKWIRQQPDFRSMAVVILTGLSLDTEIQRAYMLGANSLLVKESSKDALEKKVRLLKDYWLDANQSGK